jgi:hypothetical protein
MQRLKCAPRRAETLLHRLSYLGHRGGGVCLAIRKTGHLTMAVYTLFVPSVVRRGTSEAMVWIGRQRRQQVFQPMECDQ